jgi:hypothetical protein
MASSLAKIEAAARIEGQNSSATSVFNVVDRDTQRGAPPSCRQLGGSLTSPGISNNLALRPGADFADRHIGHLISTISKRFGKRNLTPPRASPAWYIS